MIFLYLLCTKTPVAGIKQSQGDTAVRRIFMALVFAAFLIAPAVRAQAGPVEGGHELQVWTGAGARATLRAVRRGWCGMSLPALTVFAPLQRPRHRPQRWGIRA